MFVGLYLIGAGMFFAGIFCCEVLQDQDSKGMNRIMKTFQITLKGIIGALIMFIGLLSFPLITIAYVIKLIINN